jgi:BMFP domain-containing protein YqiC
MLDSKILDEISGRIHKLLAESPAADMEKNLHALLQGIFAKLDLVTREEFDAQTHVLARAREQLTQLEQRLANLEAERTSRE